ncbi:MULTISPECIES: CRISPR-associated endonuclease Cas2 [Planktothricoides]|uniref:CRISPR-associated endoribonuclease Cas2 n=2 Tax=Planktothricoides raciborskii TaxID=132608 RepID=A0AAU8JIG1_9CYAN|nr:MULTISPECIES: CRISPR-associated endonuclease Cas2 [Planktothricoides]KOR34715.1 CRISPR-associated protein Cas2 [Planktothricoides sp. SR001]MBD2546683.1 CRISPR-associated endonuclease Cas2 [Planktothricoides raciborskii FACHB-1370]MBD2582667.1 CRISPR-associated endonuclease Cas2 [Planktothricoides raciborskii FACHB-1261]
MLFYVVVYDIPDNKRRQKVHDLLEGYGKWVQYSTFECVLSSAKFEELQKRLRYRVKLEEDSIRFYPLSRHTSGQVETWGVGPPITEFPGSVII